MILNLCYNAIWTWFSIFRSLCGQNLRKAYCHVMNDDKNFHTGGVVRNRAQFAWQIDHVKAVMWTRKCTMVPHPKLPVRGGVSSVSDCSKRAQCTVHKQTIPNNFSTVEFRDTHISLSFRHSQNALQQFSDTDDDVSVGVVPPVESRCSNIFIFQLIKYVNEARRSKWSWLWFSVGMKHDL